MRPDVLVANIITRSRADLARLGDRQSVSAKVFLYVVFVIALSAFLLPPLFQYLLSWHPITPPVPIKPSEWRALYSALDPSCTAKGRAARTCPANPLNTSLWTSNFSRADKDHRSRLRNNKGSGYWLGTTISTEALKAAYGAETNWLLLGSINGYYRIFIDGSLALWGQYKPGLERITVSLPLSRLAESKPLPVAIHIVPTPGHAYPDLLNGSNGEGFVSWQERRAHVMYWYFWDLTKQLMFFTLYASCSLLFFVFWTSAVTKQEYSYLALWTLILSAAQLKSSGVVAPDLGPKLSYSLDIMLRVAEGSFGLFTALSFSRARRSIFTVGVPSLVATGVVLGVGIIDVPLKLYWSQLIGTYFVVPAYLIGGVFCLSQATTLLRSQSLTLAPKSRILRLTFFGVLFLALSIVYMHGATKIADPAATMLYRFAPFAIVALLTAIVLIEYRKDVKFSRESPRTRYHDEAHLNRPVETVLLLIDLKDSTALSRMVEQDLREKGLTLENQTAYGYLTDIWYSRLTKVASGLGAEVLTETGDEILFSFDYERSTNALGQALSAIAAFSELHKRIASELSLPVPLEIRGSLVRGQLIPTMKQTGLSKRPAFQGNCLIDSRRLLQAEKDDLPESTKTRITIQESLVTDVSDEALRKSLTKCAVFERNDSLGGLWKFRIFKLDDLKDSQSTSVAA